MPGMSQGNILITGASTGIGRACAVRFAKLGYHVFGGVRQVSAGEELKREDARIEPLLLDVTQATCIEDVVAHLAEAPLHALINNAGIAVGGPVELLDVEDWRRQFEVNVIAVAAVTRAFLPNVRRAKGRIVNIGSIAGRLAVPICGPYDASKFALEAMTDSLRMEVRSMGIRVALIEPGAIDTPIWNKALSDADEMKSRSDPEVLRIYAGLIANVRREAERSARRGIPADAVADAVEHSVTARRPKTRYLVGRDARFLAWLDLLPDTWKDRIILNSLSK